MNRNSYYIIISFIPNNKKQSKLQITPLKFGDVWILHPKVLEFGFSPLKFWGTWILHHMGAFCAIGLSLFCWAKVCSVVGRRVGFGPLFQQDLAKGPIFAQIQHPKTKTTTINKCMYINSQMLVCVRKFKSKYLVARG